MLRLTFLHRRNPDLDPQAFAEHWQGLYAARIVATAADLKITRAHAGTMSMACYMRVHGVESPLEATLREQRGTQTPPYLGHAETWLDRSLAGAPEARIGGRAASEDEKRFIDFSRSAIWICKEGIVFDER